MLVSNGSTDSATFTELAGVLPDGLVVVVPIMCGNASFASGLTVVPYKCAWEDAASALLGQPRSLSRKSCVALGGSSSVWGYSLMTGPQQLAVISHDMPLRYHMHIFGVGICSGAEQFAAIAVTDCVGHVSSANKPIVCGAYRIWADRGMCSDP